MLFQNANISTEIRCNRQLSSPLERLIETSWRNIASHHRNDVEHLPTGPEGNNVYFMYGPEGNSCFASALLNI